MNSAILAYKLRKFAAETAVKKDPEKWEQAKRDAVASMGGKHSARAMQQAVRLYKERGGEYKGSKPSASENSMAKWTKQDWQTRPGTPEKAERKDGSTARYLPKEKWDSLSKKEQVATDRKKLRSDEQYVANTRAAKVKGDADYYAKEASLERLRTAILRNGRLKPYRYKNANLLTNFASRVMTSPASFGAIENISRFSGSNPIAIGISGAAGALGNTLRTSRLAKLEAQIPNNAARTKKVVSYGRVPTKVIASPGGTRVVPTGGFRPGRQPMSTRQVQVPMQSPRPPRFNGFRENLENALNPRTDLGAFSHGTFLDSLF